MSNNNLNENITPPQGQGEPSYSINLSQTDINAASLLVFIVLALCLHKYIVKVIDFIISIPFYRRALPIAIAGLSTLATAGLSKSSSILISIICYVLTFAYNEYIVKKEVQSTKEPLEKELSNRDELIAKYRTLLKKRRISSSDLL